MAFRMLHQIAGNNRVALLQVTTLLSKADEVAAEAQHPAADLDSLREAASKQGASVKQAKEVSLIVWPSYSSNCLVRPCLLSSGSANDLLGPASDASASAVLRQQLLNIDVQCSTALCQCFASHTAVCNGCG